MNTFIKTAMKSMNNEYASTVQDIVDCKEFIDSGSYVLNALLSGDLVNGGFPMDRITAIAGETTTGKTFFSLNAVYSFLEKYEDGAVFYFDSESAMTKEMIEARGIDSERVVQVPVTTIQEFRFQTLKVLEEYKKLTPDERTAAPIMFVLDSLGNLSSTKEVEDTADGKETRDMTKAQVIKATFRVLTNKLMQVRVPLIVTNHTYDSMGSMFPTKEVAGGCLVKGTNIQMSDGTLKAINEVTVGDVVKTSNNDEVVTNTFVFDDKYSYEIEFEGGLVIGCSDEHKFKVNGNSPIDNHTWCSADVMCMLIRSGAELTVDTIQGELGIERIHQTKNMTVYDITVENEHHYLLENGVLSHNSGLKYCASSIIMLGKRKEKDGTKVIGNIIRCKNYKNRWTKENAQVETQLLYSKGLSRYFGLLELAIEYGVWTKQTTRIVLKDGTKCFGKTINNDPEKYFTPEILAEIQVGVDKHIKYGTNSVEDVIAELEEELSSSE